MRRLLRSREISVVIVIVAIFVLTALTPARHAFFSPNNIGNTLRNISLLTVFALGETIVIISGGIDLSLGSLIAFTGMFMALMLTKLDQHLATGAAVAIAILLTLVVSLVIGVFHATLIHKLRLPPFVVTLASLLVLRSQAEIMNQQLPIDLSKYTWLLNLANGTLFPNSSVPIPIPMLLVAVLVAAAWFVLTRTRIGRYVYSIGSNEQATALSGVSVYKVKIFAYGASAILGGVAGVLWAAYGGQGDSRSAVAYELDAVAASVMGGANLMGGEGSIIGTVLGASLLYVIFSAINLTLAKPDLYRGTVVGGVLLFASLVSALRNAQNARKGNT